VRAPLPVTTVSTSAERTVEARLAPPPAAVGSRPVAPEPTSPTTALTARQLEVARLIARGYTNVQIAESLVVTPGTVANHVAHLLDRLGFDRRAQVASWVVQQGLLDDQV
jgi:DNA-binding NarL/FixJ family response regulator